MMKATLLQMATVRKKAHVTHCKRQKYKSRCDETSDVRHSNHGATPVGPVIAMIR